MFNKTSIRLRVTIITVILLTICCIGLTFVLNKSAFRMADTIKVPASNQNAIEKELYQTPIQDKVGILEKSIWLDEYIDSQGEYVYPILNTEEAKTVYQSSSVLYMIIFIVGGGFVTYFIMGSALKPINELSNQMKNKSVENLSNEIPLSNKKDEIYELTLSFNKMTRKLNEAFLMQKRFSSSAAHELRTPLTVMRTKLDVFKKRKNPNREDYDKLIESMRSQLIRLSDIVNSLLSLTNVEDIDMSQDIKLKNLIKSVCNDLYSISEEKHININITEKEGIIKGNYDLIYRAFYNLIENSIKYNVENGKVDINIEEKDGVKIIIKDTGIGIPDDMKKHVFEAFFTVDKSRSRKLGGAGIGLSIVKNVIESHNGNIIITNNEGKGSIFTISFKSKKLC